MDFFKKPVVTYIGMAIAVLAIVAQAIGFPEFLSPDIAWGIASIFGFGSIASLRAYMEVEGLKTYFATGIPIIINVLLLVGYVSPELAQALSGAFAPIVAGTLQSTANKLKT